MSLSDEIIAEWKSLGVPSSVWAPITAVESGGNPNAVGDSGTSFGELQLHIDGGQGTGYAISDLLNPVENVAIGGPPIAAAYQKGKQKGLSGFSLTEFVAANSGHPSDTGNMPSGYKNALQDAYNAPKHSLGSVTKAMNTSTSDTSVLSMLQSMGYDSTSLTSGNKTYNGLTVALPGKYSKAQGTGATGPFAGIDNAIKGVGKDIAGVAKPFEDFAKGFDNVVAWIHSGNAFWLLIGLVIVVIALVAWLRG